MMTTGIMITTMQQMIVPLFIVALTLLICTVLFVMSLRTPEKRYYAVRLILLLAFVLYSLLLITILFFYGARQIDVISLDTLSIRVKYDANIIPFATIRSYLVELIDHNKKLSIILENLLGNALLFAPFGILSPLVFPSLQKTKKFAFILILLIFLIEVIQFALGAGSFDVDDILLNTFGAFCFYGFLKIKLFRKLLQSLYLLPYEET